MCFLKGARIETPRTDCYFHLLALEVRPKQIRYIALKCLFPLNKSVKSQCRWVIGKESIWVMQGAENIKWIAENQTTYGWGEHFYERKILRFVIKPVQYLLEISFACTSASLMYLLI